MKNLNFPKQLPAAPEINANLFGSVVGFAGGFMGGEILDTIGKASGLLEQGSISPVATGVITAIGFTALLRHEINHSED